MPAGPSGAAAEENGEPITVDDMKYIETRIKPGAAETDEVLTLRVRYKEPGGDTSKLVTAVIDGEPLSVENSSKDFRFSAAVAMYAMILAESEHRGDMRLEDVRTLAKGAIGEDPHEYRAEFLSLVERTRLIIGLSSR